MRSISCLILLFLLVATSAHAQKIIPLWEKGAPGFEHLRDEPERAKDWWVKNIHNPSITVFLPPKARATGAGVLVVPGGGHRELVYEAEGTYAAQYLNSLGVAAFVLKYRLAREENSPYSLPDHSREDATRALRLIRAHASEWQLDSNRIGAMGFSAGGEVVAFVAYATGEPEPGQANSDAIEKQSAKVNFQILVYPGPLGIPASVDKSAPPVFMIAAVDDECCFQPALNLLQHYKNAGVSAEAHFYAKGGHGFNMGQRATDRSIAAWPQRLADWMADSKITIKTAKN